MARPLIASSTPRLLPLAAAPIIIGALYFGREVLIPLTLGVLLSFLVAPLVVRLQRLGLPRLVAIVTSIVISFASIGGIGYVVGAQLVDLAEQLPNHRQTIRMRIASMRGTPGAIGRALAGLKTVERELATTRPAAEAARSGAPIASDATPLPVTVKDPPPTGLQFLSRSLGPVMDPLANAAIVIVFVIFILFRREDLRDRVIRLIGPGRLNLTTQAMDDAATRVSRYLLMQTLTNAIFGLAVTGGLLLIGVRNAALWGLFAALLRFVPYVGVWIALAFPFVLSLTQFEGWRAPALVVAVWVIAEVCVGNFLGRRLVKPNMGVSELAVLVAAIFWTWLWGPVGLILSTPLTVCLVVMGKYVPHLTWLNILLGDEPVLEPHARVYQRLLAADPEEASEVVEEYVATHTSLETYERVLLPALLLAEEDRHHGRIDADRAKLVADSMRELIDDVADRARALAVKRTATAAAKGAKADGNGSASAPVDAPARPACNVTVVCLPAFDIADELAGLMLARVLEAEGLKVESVPVAALASEMLERVGTLRADIVCVSAAPPAAITHTRYLCKRLRAAQVDVQLIAGLWGMRLDSAKVRDRLRCHETDKAVSTLTEAVEQVRQSCAPLMLRHQQAPPETALR